MSAGRRCAQICSATHLVMYLTVARINICPVTLCDSQRQAITSRCKQDFMGHFLLRVCTLLLVALQQRIFR